MCKLIIRAAYTVIRKGRIGKFCNTFNGKIGIILPFEKEESC